MTDAATAGVIDPRLADYLAQLGVAPEALDGWTVHVAQRGGEDVGFAISMGPEIHMLALPGKSAMTRKNILDIMRPIFAKHGFLATRVPLAETDHRLRAALGFTQNWADADYTYWTMTALPYQKTKPQGNPPCQSL